MPPKRLLQPKPPLDLYRSINAPMESFFGSLKNELVHRTTFPTREAARRAIFEYVETSTTAGAATRRSAS